MKSEPVPSGRGIMVHGGVFKCILCSRCPYFLTISIHKTHAKISRLRSKIRLSIGLSKIYI